MPRVILDEPRSDSDYFVNQESPLEFVDSGCVLLNCVLGGGWPLGRISNVVGDNSTGKTLLAIEAMANFKRQYPRGFMFYREAEAAFDERYAEALGMPVDDIDFVNPDEFTTVEDFFADLKSCAEKCRNKGVPGFYVQDSLDALASKDELGRDFDEGSYETKKAKQLGKLFRMSTSDVARADMHLMIVSQTRDKIGVTFGHKKTRSGGRSLDFYASQVLWLSQRDHITETRDKVKRAVGIAVRAQMRKSKIALPYRECDFTIRFGQGIDSLSSSLDWLEEVKRWEEVIDVGRRTYENQVEKMADADYWAETRRVSAQVVRIWREIEAGFMAGARSKYRQEESVS